MGHAGAIIGGADDTAAAKKRIMAECGIAVADSPADMASALLKLWGKPLSSVENSTALCCRWANHEGRTLRFALKAPPASLNAFIL
jgi:hypothetical protein